MKTIDFPRPLGVGGDVPRFPDAPVAKPRIDLSLEATPPAEDLRNALCIIGPIQDSMLKEALARLLTSALRKIEVAA